MNLISDDAPPLGFAGFRRKPLKILQPQERLMNGCRVDDLHRLMFLHVARELRAKPEMAEPLLHLLSASRHLERIADSATNIAEDVYYLVEGEIIRHRADIAG